MLTDEQATYYDVLELTPDASPQDIRTAYLRAKAAYNKDSVALYSLISEEETKELLHRIEEAYLVLSSVERRKEYDRNHGLLEVDEDAMANSRPPRNQKIISIDRVPPMENSGSETEILVPPSTDFGGAPAFRSGNPTPSPNPDLGPVPPPSFSKAQSTVAEVRARVEPQNDLISQEIAQENEWKGAFLRKVREARRISIEEMAEATKISKTYLIAIEEDNFSKLPAAVYLRGFVVQVSKILKLPHLKVVPAYMVRYLDARPDQKA